MSSIKAWLLQGTGLFFLWLFSPIRGARRWRIGGLEAFRSFFSGTTVFLVIGLLQYTLDHLNLIPLTPDQALQTSSILGTVICVLHGIVQLYQWDKGHPPTPPAPLDQPGTLPVPLPTPAPAPASTASTSSATGTSPDSQGLPQ